MAFVQITDLEMYPAGRKKCGEDYAASERKRACDWGCSPHDSVIEIYERHICRFLTLCLFCY